MFADGTAYDVASVVSLVAGGAQMVATGMGTSCRQCTGAGYKDYETTIQLLALKI